MVKVPCVTFSVTRGAWVEQRLKEWELLKEAYMNVASLREPVANIPQLDGEDDGEEAEVSVYAGGGLAERLHLNSGSEEKWSAQLLHFTL